jgi:hypothetical protein
LAKTTTTKIATFVGDIPGMVGYGGNVTVGSCSVEVVVAVLAAIMRAAGAPSVSSFDDPPVSTATLAVSTLSGSFVLVCSTAAASVSPVGLADDFSSA